jgi:hypothetical protein
MQDNLEEREEQSLQVLQLPTSYRNLVKVENPQAENQIAEGLAGLTSVHNAKRKGEDAEGRRNSSQWTPQPTPLKMPLFQKVK